MIYSAEGPPQTKQPQSPAPPVQSSQTAKPEPKPKPEITDYASI